MIRHVNFDFFKLSRIIIYFFLFDCVHIKTELDLRFGRFEVRVKLDFLESNWGGC